MLRVLILFAFLSGCENYNDPEILEKNKSTLSKSGDDVGVLPDGRHVTRYRIDMGNMGSHWVYVVDGSVSVNRKVSNGKTSSDHTEVMIY